MLVWILDRDCRQNDFLWIERTLLELLSQAGDKISDVEKCARWLPHARKLLPSRAAKSISEMPADHRPVHPQVVGNGARRLRRFDAARSPAWLNIKTRWPAHAEAS
jgi:hypothetical protein